ncbi:hypothetical protein GPECTOR_12g378 [Gonium pectorale]|uniref:Peptidase M11 gametolysin domain-containing protein n=1 Tax=Gonium pectorale TaxID=33097 RepID=A0A150GNI0_GONPE|nr:hypothetical protein GPECTOR_12g378 [Gonium pectorale]|eukprot:KXZ51416.1 hypothetical protein GPECTOR_12g378 [Gonium pectorale]
MTYDAAALQIVNISLSCDDGAGCDYLRIASAGIPVLRTMLGADMDAYGHLVFVLPSALECPWNVAAVSPGNVAWYRPNGSGILNTGTVMQGLLSTCPSAPELLRLGWATPLAVLNGSNLPEDGAYKSYRLPATYLTGDGVVLRIVPDWLGSAYTR